MSAGDQSRFTWTDAFDDGIRFILQPPPASSERLAKKVPHRDLAGGLIRKADQGHFVTITGRGGTAKSVLALQFLTDLIVKARKRSTSANPAAFYFTLEASPHELANQLRDFRLLDCLRTNKARDELTGTAGTLFTAPEPQSLKWNDKGLYVEAIPSPVTDVLVLVHQVKQTIAECLAKRRFDELVGVVIDPLGGVRQLEKSGADIVTLKHFADSHKTFLFLLAEEHVYEQNPAIEHYSQTVLQLRYDSAKPSRRIVVQKARSQPFRPGNHQLELRSDGVRVFPSVEAQSDSAHYQMATPEPTEKPRVGPFMKNPLFGALKEIRDGSVVFLMGPAGTFKQPTACNFATSFVGAGRALYISFKADIAAVEGLVPNAVRYWPNASSYEPPDGTLFVDARNPLSTPEEILFVVRRALDRTALSPTPIRRAVVWGLRRLADMPNFAGSTAVQFLEALVTLLQANSTTSLLVDWPELDKRNTLPIVDLCQYILLTRLSSAKAHFDLRKKELEDADEIWNGVWEPGGTKAQHATLLRVQRDDVGFHRNQGFVFFRAEGVARAPRTSAKADFEIGRLDKFERSWVHVGEQWEQDPSLS